jgi:hypothetical protein
MSELVPLSNLVSALKAATDAGKSGAFFITTDQQHSAMVTLSGGTITGVKFRNTRGYDAATSLSRVGQLKYQSAAEPTELPGETALNTAAVLEILTTGESDAVSGEGAPPAIDLDAVRQRYIAAIGPIGGALFDEAVEELGSELSKPAGVRALIEKLVEQIDDEAEAASFRSDAGV